MAARYGGVFKPQAIKKDSVNLVLDAGWIAKDKLCHGVTAGSVKACG